MKRDASPKNSPLAMWRFALLLCLLPGLRFFPARADQAPPVQCPSALQHSDFYRPITKLIVRRDAANRTDAVHRTVSHAIRRRSGKHKQIAGSPDPGHNVTYRAADPFLRDESVACEPDTSVLRFRGPPDPTAVSRITAIVPALCELKTSTRAVREITRTGAI